MGEWAYEKLDISPPTPTHQRVKKRIGLLSIQTQG